MAEHRMTVGSRDDDLDRRLNTALEEFNETASGGLPPQRELTVKIEDGEDLFGGVSGWTWGTAGSVALLWVHGDHRGTGVGSQLLNAFEQEARSRGCTPVFVTSFTFQAPDFYRRRDYQEVARWDSIPTPASDDVHLRKQL